ncbi:unnamed protein product [Adineta steineri]|uniref:TLDc domain-containing protein n=1 Tax=Adineta steineri TaxID=433720 RepID=A0A815LW80_9BILA|nr:unnamed protein product [Adineta steineri]CAF1413216.1 unnamed protein product [Adineta steineri]CAF3716388.1 unnamed protein product [Adineta steineri]CAF4018159.1 unnamed protein product [Adineta steineri]
MLPTDMITLNVGGVRYITSIDILTRENDTFFAALFSGRWQLKQNPNDNSVFIDGNGELFKHILEYFRTNSISSDIMTNESLLRRLIREADYFCIENLIYILTEPERRREQERLRIENTFPNGTLLRLEHKVKLNEFYGKSTQKWELIYKATRDGFSANAFHLCCNNKGPTMTIIQSNNNYIFGGYTSASWISSELWQTDERAFLFTLTNPHNIPPTKYTVKPEWVRYAIHNYDRGGPIFGANFDINVSDNSNSNNSSYSNFSRSYSDTTGYGNNTFTGTKSFTTSEIEVFKLA